MSRLTSLRRLILSGWCYSSLPGVVGRLSQIQELDFRSAVIFGAGKLPPGALLRVGSAADQFVYMCLVFAVLCKLFSLTPLQIVCVA